MADVKRALPLRFRALNFTDRVRVSEIKKIYIYVDFTF